MITLVYQEAIISFCLDMRDPDAKSIPIASLLAADLNDGRSYAVIVALASPSFPGVKLSTVSSLLLHQVPFSLVKIVTDTWDGLPGADTHVQVVEALAKSLRTSVHVSTILDSVRKDLDGTDCGVEEMLIDTAVDTFERVRAEHKPLTTPSPSPSRMPPAAKNRPGSERGSGLSRSCYPRIRRTG